MNTITQLSQTGRNLLRAYVAILDEAFTDIIEFFERPNMYLYLVPAIMFILFLGSGWFLFAVVRLT